jgi:hypothetical protein
MAEKCRLGPRAAGAPRGRQPARHTPVIPGLTSGLPTVRSEASVGRFLSALLRERDDKSAFRSRL